MENANTLISSLLNERSNFIIIGLTGRTGSGCSTASKILTNTHFKAPESNEINFEKSLYFKDLDKLRYNVIQEYSLKTASPFKLIKISHLISSILFQEKKDNFHKLLSHIVDDAYKEQIMSCNVLNEYEEIRMQLRNEFPKIQAYLNEEDSEIIFENDELEKWFIFIANATKKIKSLLKNHLNNCYTKLYQHVGDSIRRTAKIQDEYIQQEINPKGLHLIPNRINKIIKAFRKFQKEKLYIVIDAIRNPYEAKFLKDRYAAFYLVSISAPDIDRKNYLQTEYKFSIDKIKELDAIESAKDPNILKKFEKPNISSKDKQYYGLTTANVKKCIEISDIHIFNPRNEPNNHNILKAQLAWYISLMKHPGLITPTSLERVMQIAYTAKLNSGCISRQVGAVVTDQNFSIKAVGWNDVAKGQTPCNLRSLKGLINYTSETMYSEYERTNDNFQDKAKEKLISLKDIESLGRNSAYCFKDLHNSINKQENQVHTRSLHAEENAFLQISKYGGAGIENGKLFTTASPCELCAKKAYQLGIEEIIYIDPYPGIAIQHILKIGDNEPKLIQFRGAIGKAYHKLYEPLMPYKDELKLLESEY